MNLKALITTVVLGTSSIAMASPSSEAGFRVGVRADASWSYATAPAIRDHRDFPRTEQAPMRWFRPRVDPYTQATNVKLNTDSSEYVGPIYSVSYGRGLQALTDPTRIVATGSVSRQIIRIQGRFHTLALQPIAGRVHVNMVNVRFKNGSTQTIEVGRTLSSRQPLALDVARGDIDYIVVYGSSQGTFRVLGA